MWRELWVPVNKLIQAVEPQFSYLVTNIFMTGGAMWREERRTR